MNKKFSLTKILALGATSTALLGGALATNTTNVDASSKVTLLTFKHNAYKYNRHGKRIGKSVLKKGTRHHFYRTAYIHGKKYYQIGSNSYIKASNATLKTTSSSNATSFNENDPSKYVFSEMVHYTDDPKPQTTDKLSGFNQADLVGVITDGFETNANLRPLRTTKEGVITDSNILEAKVTRADGQKFDSSNLAYGEYDVTTWLSISKIKPAPYSRNVKVALGSYRELYDMNTNNRNKNLKYVSGVVADFKLPANATSKRLTLHVRVLITPQGYKVISHRN